MSALNLTGVLGDIGNLASGINGQTILDNLVVGAGGTLLLSGLQTQAGQDAIDPAHLFHKPATATSPAITGVVQGGNVMTMSKFMALTPDQQKMIQAIGYTIIPG